ncbi:hypothetical protein [Bacillus sp. T3]|uniref:hypothetical protein n=1 Tax=Bacillus sp. T3 TaxID=467262 RepID=UPI002980C4B2|nr:hypothetical protein [Bacillus sp. T3]
MEATFWTNTIWYLLLGLVSIVEIFVVIYHADRKLFTFAYFLSILGLTFIFETVVLIYLDSYEYFPKITKNPPLAFDDNLAGNVFSQVSVSASALLYVIFNLRYYWVFIFAGIYGLVEELFLALNIYQHHWYRTWMTLVLISIFFWIANMMYAKLKQGMKSIAYYLYILLALFPLYTVLLLWGIFILFRIQSFNTEWLSNPIWSRSSIVIMNYTVFSIIMIIIILKKLHWVIQAIVIFFLYLIYFTCYRLGWFVIRDGWFLVVSTVAIFWLYISVHFLDKAFGSSNKFHTFRTDPIDE